MSSLKHVHTYVKYKKRSGYFRCADSHCTHILDKEAVLGKASLCTSCGKEFILSREDLKRVKPRCLECSNTARGKVFRATQVIQKKLVGSVEDKIKDPSDDPWF